MTAVHEELIQLLHLLLLLLLLHGGRTEAAWQRNQSHRRQASAGEWRCVVLAGAEVGGILCITVTHVRPRADMHQGSAV